MNLYLLIFSNIQNLCPFTTPPLLLSVVDVTELHLHTLCVHTHKKCVFDSLVSYIKKKWNLDLPTKVTIIPAFKMTLVFTFTVIFFSSCSFELLYSVVSVQPTGLDLVFLLYQCRGYKLLQLLFIWNVFNSSSLFCISPVPLATKISNKISDYNLFFFVLFYLLGDIG